jgi:hypothetical protein
MTDPIEATAETYRAERDAARAEVERLTGELAEAERKLGGGCESSGGFHIVIRQGKYSFCGACGESLSGVRYCHQPRAIPTPTTARDDPQG